MPCRARRSASRYERFVAATPPPPWDVADRSLRTVEPLRNAAVMTTRVRAMRRVRVGAVLALRRRPRRVGVLALVSVRRRCRRRRLLLRPDRRPGVGAHVARA